jgi:hypothetical protein
MVKAICNTCGSETENQEAIERVIRHPICPCCCSIGSIYLKRENLTEEDKVFLRRMSEITEGYNKKILKLRKDV